VSAWFSSGNT